MLVQCCADTGLRTGGPARGNAGPTRRKTFGVTHGFIFIRHGFFMMPQSIVSYVSTLASTLHGAEPLYDYLMCKKQRRAQGPPHRNKSTAYATTGSTP